MDQVASIEMAVPERGDVDALLGVTGQVGTFSEEEVATVQELLEASFDQGPERSGYYFVVARDARTIAGFVCYGPRPLTQGTFDLYWIAVAPSYARCGIGGALLESVVAQIRAGGGRLLLAETSGKPEYLATRRFYLGHEFDQAARIAGFYAPGDDLVLFVRRLDGEV